MAAGVGWGERERDESVPAADVGGQLERWATEAQSEFLGKYLVL